MAGTVVVCSAVLLAACGRSSGPSRPSAATSGPTTASSAPAGTFGDLGRICGPGDPQPLTGRGLSGTTIHVGTMGDPGSTVTPGLEQEYFDVAKAFTKWCNAAGGINGRKIVVDNYDAKLFNGAQQIVSACQSEFMLVGGGNAFDAVDVKPRIDCKLAQIPALDVSPQAGLAPLQVQPTSNSPTHYGVGGLRLLAAAYPASRQGLGIGSSNVASLSPQGRYAKQAWESLGYKVTVVQEKPTFVTNFRPYMEQLKTTGAKAYNEIASQNPSPEVNAMRDVGYEPSFVLWSIQFYDPKSVAAARTVSFPPSYVALAALPAELVDDYPVLQQIRSIMNAGLENPKFTSFTGLAFSAWTLWAKSATDCGADLTTQCILAKAGSHTDWDAGGLFPPNSTIPGKQTQSDCVLLVRLTPKGFVYDKKVTQPNKGPYNCDPRNLVSVSGS
jgi:Periplasmic binding protein